MGNSLGCVKEPKEKAVGKAPLSPKKRVRFKRRRKGKRRAMPEAAPQEDPPALEVAEDEEAPKSKAVPQQEGGEEPTGSWHCGGDPNPAALHPGLIVQVKERFQGEVQKARLVLEPQRPGAAGASPEEGTTVIARLLENPAEKDCEKAVSRLVELQRSGAGSRRAVLLPLRGGTVSGEEPAKSRAPGASSALDARGKGDSNDPSSSTAWTCSSAAEPGTVSELSTPSPMVDQLENPSMGRTSGLPSSRAGEGDGHGLPASRSPSSFSGRSGGAARSSSGYGSDPARRPAEGAGAGGTTASPSEGGRRLAAEGLAWRGSSGTAGGMVSVCVYPRPLSGAGWGGPGSVDPRSCWPLGTVILARCNLGLSAGGRSPVQKAPEAFSPLSISTGKASPRDRPILSSAPGTGGQRAALAGAGGCGRRSHGLSVPLRLPSAGRLLSPVARVPSGLLGRVRVWGVPFLLPALSSRAGSNGRMWRRGGSPCSEGAPRGRGGHDAAFWSPLLLFGGCSLGTTGQAEGTLGFGQALHTPGQACGWRSRKGAVAPDTFAGLGPVSQPPSGLWCPATGCLMHEADVGRVWKGLAPGPVSFCFLFLPVPP